MNSIHTCSIGINIRNVIRKNLMKDKKRNTEEFLQILQRIKDNCDILMSFPDGLSYVYVLELENQKYYVGYTENFNSRMVSHFGGNGSKWTKIHIPISIKEVFRGDKSNENDKTIDMMVKYGYENVRGGNYCKVEMFTQPILVTESINIKWPTE